MDVELRNGLQKMLEAKADKYGLKNLFFMTFSATLGFRARMCAADYVHAAAALLERPDIDESSATCFLDAADALDVWVLKQGVLGGKEGNQVLLWMRFWCDDELMIKCSYSWDITEDYY